MIQNIDFQQFMKKLAEERNNKFKIISLMFILKNIKCFIVISFKFQ